jgi:hypothetical protein
MQAQAQQQQQQQQQRPQRKAWAHDFGHLEGVQPPPAARTSASGREGGRAAGRPHKRWSETWVGDFGHLQQFPRCVCVVQGVYGVDACLVHSTGLARGASQLTS